MPKITVHGGASNRFEPAEPKERPGEGKFFQQQPVDEPTTAGAARAFLATMADAPTVDGDQADGGEQLSAGSSSSTSSPPPETSSETSPTSPPPPAPTTVSRSRRGRAASSTADPTDGSGTE